MKSDLIHSLTANFEDHAQQTESGVEYWLARDIQHLLGYAEWRNFNQSAVSKAKIACEVSGHLVSDHFVDANKMVDLGSGGKREIEDILLTRYACYLVAQNGDPRKEEIAFAQSAYTIVLLKDMEIDLPDFNTQRKIAGILSAYDDLIENNLRRIKILEEMAQSLYREWFVHFRFPGHESAKLVDSPLGQIPKGWEVKAISDFGKVVTGKTPSKANEDFFGEDISFLKTPDMHGQMFILRTNEYLSTAGAQSQANKTLPVGSICVSCIGTIGVVSITTELCQTNQQINSVVMADEASREFLFFWLREAKQMLENLGSNGATMGNVNKSKFEGMKPSSPPPSPRLWRSRRLRRPRREVVLTGRLKPALRRLNPDLPVGAIEGTVEEICRDFFLTALSLAEANREMDKLPSGNSKFKPEEVASMSDLMNGFQCFLGFHRLVKLAFLLKWNSVFTESAVSRMHESGDFV